MPALGILPDRSRALVTSGSDPQEPVGCSANKSTAASLPQTRHHSQFIRRLCCICSGRLWVISAFRETRRTSAAPPAADMNCVGGDWPNTRVLDVGCWDQPALAQSKRSSERQRCRQTLIADSTRITASIGSKNAAGTTSSRSPPMNVPTTEPAAMTSRKLLFLPMTAKLPSWL